MGNILCGDNSNAINDEGFYEDGHFELYGDVISPQTRAILVMLKVGKVNHKFINIDRIRGDHTREPYVS
jgi:hypothetical protein